MAETFGWAGKLLRVDLSTGSITTEDSAKYQEYIGGMGMAYRIMYDEAPMDLDPYDEKALVIFGVGPLTGSGVPCSGRMNITFRSTWSKGHSIVDAHMGGHIGPQLKYAGYDGIVVTGISAKPVYLKIEDDKVSLEDASAVWGKGTFESNAWLIEQTGREFEAASIGPAGENLMDYSTLNTSFGNAGGAGVGAALGNKKLKGIVIRGTGTVKVADPKKVLELSSYMMGNLIGGNNNHNVPALPQSWAEFSAVSGKNRWSGAPGRVWGHTPDGEEIDAGEQPYNDINKIAYRCLKGVFDFGEVASNYIIKSGGCQSCPIRCYTQYEIDPLAEYDLPIHNSNTCMPVLYGNYAYPGVELKDFKYEGDAKMVINLAWSHAVDDKGLWDNYGNINRDLKWFLSLPREEAVGYIGEEEYDSLPWDWMHDGDPRWEVEIIRRLAMGEGKLSVIAKGTLAMMEAFGLPKEWLDRADGTNSNLMYCGFPNHHGPAEAWQTGMLYNMFYNRDCMIHEIVCETGSGAPYEVTKKVMEDFFGEGCYDKSKAYTPINENKVKLAIYCAADKNFHDSSTLCNWMWPMTQSPSKERDYHGDLDLQADFMTAVTGKTYTQDDLQEFGKKILHMLRVMTAISFKLNCDSANLRTEHDAITGWVFDKEPDFKPFEEGTTKLDREDMKKAMDMMYTELGWDVETGIPTAETLKAYGLEDMAKDLADRGII